ncbi:MAG: phosphotransferase family protein, partial [Pyrinomonadaceae bacterium]
MEESSFIDQPRGVRAGEELNEQKLASYLRAHLPNLHAALTVKQFPAGFSNLTYLLQFGDRQLVLRRPPIGARIKTAHDMGREFRILSHLHPVYRKVPEPLLFCEDEAVIGAPFYVMERVSGIILRAQSPEGSQLTPETMRRLSSAFVENLVEIHAIDYRGAGLGDLGSPQGYVHRQIEGWTKRYYNAQTDDVREVDQLADWLRAN